MIWWLLQPSRARNERLKIAELENQHEWLRGVKWDLAAEARLSANFEIEHLGEFIPMSITYPSFFPDMPPQVIPGAAVRLSGHQYGVGGELCLEYRPDNWDPSYTGAMMIESARRLLLAEAPAEGVQAQVESAHRTTPAQDLRSAKLRFKISPEFETALKLLPLHEPVEFEMSEHFIAKHWLALPRRIGATGSAMWECGPDVPEFWSRTGSAIRLDPSFRWRIRAKYEVLNAIAVALKHNGLAALLESSTNQSVILIECAGDINLIWLSNGNGSRDVFGYSTVRVPSDADRLPSEYARLPELRVAIVGCGSLGSKIAASLARAGVGNFVLVDGDILFQANLVRNDLDWLSVGLSKPDAVAERISEIRPSANVLTRRILLGGQESSAATDAALVAVGKCDLIVDATADPQVFNLCAAVARNEKKTLVWGEVFGGGIGGLIMRLRAGIEPVPHAARRQVSDWCVEHGRALPEGEVGQYGLALDETSPPLIADDADVSIIAAYMVRFALDALTRMESLFPHPAYAIGLKGEWIFDAPFDTWPIALQPEGLWGPEKDDNLEQELAALTAELFPPSAE